MKTAKTAATAESGNQWPEIRTVRKLQVPLTDDDIRNLGRENAHIGAEIEALTAAKKAATQNFAAQITERATRRSVNDTVISNGWTEKDVECEWLYEVNRKGAFDAARKVLIRKDTGEVIDEALIQDAERQTVLPLDPTSEPEQPLPDFMAAEKKVRKPRKKKAESPVATDAAIEADKNDSDAEAAANN